MKKNLLCHAHGREGAWEAICVDLDIAVQGRTLESVQSGLSKAISTYTKAAHEEEEKTASKLLNRRAPLSVRLNLLFRFVRHVLSKKDDNNNLHANFELPCPA